MTHLFQPFSLRGLSLKNRIVVSPMQTYSAPDAAPTSWHRAHLGRFALGGAGLVMIEATAVSPEGRSTAADLGLWSQKQGQAMAGLAEAVHACGAPVGLQLQHAGRKAFTAAPWDGFRPVERAAGEEVLGPGFGAAAPGGHTPRQMERSDMDRLLAAYRAAARRADGAGIDLVEIHMAHGYLLHSFLSPLSNSRTDEFGGSIENRMRFPLAVVSVVREAWPDDKPMACRISSVDGIGIGWSLEDSKFLVDALLALGVDLIDCSSGGMTLPRKDMLLPRGPAFQAPLAGRLRAATGAAVMAVGGITEPAQAEAILGEGKADLVAIGRQMLIDPNWALNAAARLDQRDRWTAWPQPFGWWLERRERSLAS